MSETLPKSDGPGRKVSRAVKLVVAGGVASGAAFAAVTGISSAASSGGTAPSTAVSPSTSTSPPATHPGLPEGRRFAGPGGFGGPGGMGGPGGSGTVTAIDKTSSPQTLTLRTETGTETVDISSTTTFTKEMQTIDLNAIALNDVVRVVPVRPTSGSAPSGTTPVTPGTGTVAASRVIVVEPTFTGRVTSISPGAGGMTTLSLVGEGGRLLTVNTSGSTKYYSGTTSSSASAVTVGTYISAEGAQTGITSLTADVVSVRTAPVGGPRAGAWGPRNDGTNPATPAPLPSTSA